jgi:peptide/nickel transport system permease protein
MAARRIRLRLNDPVWERYVDWLQGIARGDFGLNREGQKVSVLLGQAMGTTFRLIILATIFSILLGLVIGIITAVRQYSALDYTSTFAAFLFFSLPVFWLAVMLKEFGAIKLNNYLEEPGFSVVGIIVLSVVAGVIAGGLVGGSRPRRLAGFGAVAVAMGALLVALDTADWMSNPGLSLPVVIFLSLAAGLLAAIIYAPSSNRPVMLAGVAGAAAAVIASILLDGWITDMTWIRLALSIVLTLGLGAAVGAAVGGEIDRRAATRAGMTAAFLVAVIVGFDRFISAWEPGRTIATIGPKTPNLDAPFWETMVDYAGHQVLPSLALALIGFATFMRFTRSSMLDTLKSDYVRTAKAKGLPATQVVMRHAFRTALIPVMTVVTISFATIIEGAVITERVFAWKGMGSLFVEGLLNVDPYPVMGFLVVVSVSIVLLNAVADIMYAYLDPRIRR